MLSLYPSAYSDYSNDDIVLLCITVNFAWSFIYKGYYVTKNGSKYSFDVSHFSELQDPLAILNWHKGTYSKWIPSFPDTLKKLSHLPDNIELKKMNGHCMDAGEQTIYKVTKKDSGYSVQKIGICGDTCYLSDNKLALELCHQYCSYY